MALSQSAFFEVLDALKVSDSPKVIRRASQVMSQQLIDAEAAAFIGAEPHQRTEERQPRIHADQPWSNTESSGTALQGGSSSP